MRRYGLLAAGLVLAVAAVGCDIEGEAQAGTLDERQPAAAADPDQGVASGSVVSELYADARGGCPYAKHKQADGEVGCGGGCGGEVGCGGGGGEYQGQGCGGGCGGAAAFDGDLGGGCGDGY